MTEVHNVYMYSYIHNMFTNLAVLIEKFWNFTLICIKKKYNMDTLGSNFILFSKTSKYANSQANIQWIIKYMESGFACDSDVLVLHRFYTNTGSNYGSASKRVMHVAAWPLLSFLKCHTKI